MNEIFQKMLKRLELNGFNVNNDELAISNNANKINLLVDIIQLYDCYIVRMPHLQHGDNDCYLIINDYADRNILLIIE